MFGNAMLQKRSIPLIGKLTRKIYITEDRSVMQVLYESTMAKGEKRNE
jgi:hypothetical protein